MRERWLKEITGIVGVEGVLLVSSNGQLVENFRTDFEHRILTEISKNVLRMIAINGHAGLEIREIELAWKDYRILAMSTNTFTLVIFCSSKKVLSLLRITMSVVAAHLMEDRKTTKKIKKSGKEKNLLLDKNHLDELEINLISKLQ